MQHTPIQFGVNDPFTTVYRIFVIVSGIGTLLGAVWLAFVYLKHKGAAVLAKEWEELAHVKAERITEMERQLSEMKQEFQALMAENELLKKLNLDLQQRVEELLRRG